MIVETILQWAATFIQSLFSTLQIVTLPLDFLTVLFDILCYGVWVIGADMMAIILANITFWLGTRFAIGLVIFIWRLLPLT